MLYVVLLQDVPKLGKKGEIKPVAPGYFRNFLETKKLARIATEADVHAYKDKQEQKVQNAEASAKNAEEVMKALKGIRLEIEAKASDKGKLFEAIHQAQLLEMLSTEHKLQLEGAHLNPADFKQVGEHQVTLSLGGKSAEFILEVKASA